MEFRLYLTFLSVLQLYAYMYNVLGIRVSQKNCEDYRKRFSPPAKIFNDKDNKAAPKEFPFMAIIHDGEWWWNGILISENFVLSKATWTIKGPHNFYKSFSSTTAYVILGDLDRATSNDDSRQHRFDIIEEFRNNNINLFKLNGSIKFDDSVRPACLPHPESEIPQQLLQIFWYDTNTRDYTSLRKVQLNYVSDKNCTETYNSYGYGRYVHDIANKTIFCTGVKKGDPEICEYQDVTPFEKYRINFSFLRLCLCDAISGSALVNRRDSLDEIVGVSLFSFRCNTLNVNPIVSLRVASYIDWIESIVWPNEFATDNIMDTESQTTYTIEPTTDTPTSTTDKMKMITHAVPITTNKTAITAESLSSTTTKLPPKEETKSLELKYIIITVSVLLLILCVAVACFQANRSRKTQNVALNVIYAVSRD